MHDEPGFAAVVVKPARVLCNEHFIHKIDQTYISGLQKTLTHFLNTQIGKWDMCIVCCEYYDYFEMKS